MASRAAANSMAHQQPAFSNEGPPNTNREPSDSNALRRLMFEQSPDLMCVLRRDGHIAEINPEFVRVLGYPEDELVDAPWARHAHPDDQRRASMTLHRLQMGAFVRGVHLRWKVRGGDTRWLSWNAQGDPESEFIFAVARDVTDEHAAAHRQEAQHALETLVTSTAARLVALTSDQLMDGMNRSLREVGELLEMGATFVSVLPAERDGLWKVAGWTRQGTAIDLNALERIGREEVDSLLDELSRPEVLRWPGYRDAATEELAAVRVLRDAGAQYVALVPLAHAGSVMGLFGLVGLSPEGPEFDPELALLRVLGELFANSLRRRTMETELLESKERFRNIVQESPMGLHMYELRSDGELVLLDANPAAERITGLDTTTIVGTTLGETFPSLATSGTVKRFRLAAALGIPWGATELQFEMFANSGPSRSITLEMYAFQTSPGRVAAMFQDVTERRGTESALRASEQRLRAIFEAATNVAFSITDANLDEPHLVEVSPGAEHMFGYQRSELADEPLRRLLVPDSAKLLRHGYELMRKGGPGFSGEMTLVRRNGELFPALVRTNPLRDERSEMYGVLIVSLDVSEQRQLETFLQQAQKMEALGTLAGGIAHDFNNILGAVMGYSELARLQLPETSPVASHVDQVLAAATRARDLVGQILAFSRRGDQEARPMDLAPVVREALRMLRASIPSTIEIRQRVAPESGVVRANPTQIHQVLMNLCTNAAHAMRDQGGVLHVEIAPEHLDEATATELPDCAAGHYVKLTVRDTGHGIEPSALARVFDPYFTTKEKGVGTGLGLAVVHGIVKAFGGSIQVASEVGVGTVFEVYLPQVDEPTARESVRPIALPTGHERILFVDDEEALVITTRRMLERLGYQVTVSISSRDALERFSRDPQGFDLVITDQTMPHMTGDQLARKLLEIRPDVRIILCTGFSETVTEEKALGYGLKDFLMKPLVLRTLAAAVRNALDAPAG